MTALLDTPAPTAGRARPDARAWPGSRPRRGSAWLRGDRVCLLAVTAVAFVANGWGLANQGLGNQYYAAATRSMTDSWSNFFFVSLDPGGFIAVDKPPAHLWIGALSARVFGYGSWSILLPGAVAGAVAVALLWCTVQRLFGPLAATIAAAVLAVSPVNVAVNRLNLPEPFLIAFLVASAWAIQRSFGSIRPLRWLVLGGAFVGLAFNTKMLAAYVPGPALALAVVCAAARWRERLVRGAVFGLSCVVTSAPWILVVDAVSPSSRPYVGGSTDDTVWNLVLGYNGLGRVSGGAMGGRAPAGGAAAAGPGGTMGGSGGVMGGTAGPLRLLGDALASQIGWLLPLAVVGCALAIWVHRSDRPRRASVVLWAGWAVMYAAVFSAASGTFHAYYTSVMVPGLAVSVGVGMAALCALLREHPRWWIVAAGALGATVALQLVIIDREPTFYAWAKWVLAVGAAAGAAGAIGGLSRRSGRAIVVSLCLAFAALLFTPTMWVLSEVANPALNATLPQAGPRTGPAGSTFGSASWNGDPALAAFLREQHSGEVWDLVVGNAQTASGYIAYHDLSVMALGGFMGSDPAASVESVAADVEAGRLRYVLVTGGSRGQGMGAMVGGTARLVLDAVASGCPVASGAPTSAGIVYDCVGAADALRAAAA